jgi:ABC-type lipoprotein release transport system permease subunit
VRVFGIDPPANVSKPYQDGVVAGEFLAPDDRGGILIGQKLAKSLGLVVGQQVSLLVNTSDEHPDEAIFTIRGLYDTGIPSFDDTTLLMPLAKAQTFTRAGDRASTIVILLNRQEDTDKLAPRLKTAGLEVLTWHDLNQVLLQSVEMTNGIMYLIYMIVLAVVAVVIANTLLMSVFERTREMGILASLGMKGRQILALFILEAAILGLVGIVLGDLLGSLGVLDLATEGYHIGDVASITTAQVAYGETIYGRFAPGAIAILSAIGMMITLLASLYPAWLASRMEPIEALRAQ